MLFEQAQEVRIKIGAEIFPLLFGRNGHDCESLKEC